MSLYVTMVINDDPVGSVTITRQHDDNGTNIDAVNEYRWVYSHGGKQSAAGTVKHRYGNGAVVLASEVLNEIAARHRIAAAVMKLDAEGVSSSGGEQT